MTTNRFLAMNHRLETCSLTSTPLSTSELDMLVACTCRRRQRKTMTTGMAAMFHVCTQKIGLNSTVVVVAID
jgi:hypothetical protein